MGRRRLQPVAVRCLFGAIPTDRHTAPAALATARVIRKQQRAGLALAVLHVLEIFIADKLCETFSDR
jgi:hypothetical protein